MISKVNNAQPSFGMAMYNIPQAHIKDFASVVNARSQLKKKGLDSFIKRAGKNPHFDLIYKPGDLAGCHTGMFVLDGISGDKVAEFNDTGASYIKTILNDLKQKYDKAGFFGKIKILVAAKKAKYQSQHSHPEMLMPDFMMQALNRSEKEAKIRQKFLDMVADTRKILDNNSEIMKK